MHAEAAYSHGFMTKCADRGYAYGDVARDYAGSAIGAGLGAAGAAGLGMVSGGLAYGSSALLAALAATSGRAKLLRGLAAAGAGALGTGFGSILGGISGAVEGGRNGARIGARRAAYGLDGFGYVAPATTAQDPQAAVVTNLLGPWTGISGAPAYVETRTGSLGRALAASQVNEAATLAMAPVFAAKAIKGKAMSGKATAIGAVLANILTSSGLTMALAHNPRQVG